MFLDKKSIIYLSVCLFVFDPRPHRVAVHSMDYRIYEEEVVCSTVVTVVLLVNTHKRSEMRELINNFKKAVRHLGTRVNLCSLCYKTHKWWLRDVLKQCSGMDREEAKARVSACYSGEVVTVLALFGAGMQLCIFPEYVSVNGVRATDEKRKAIQKRKRAVNEAPVRQKPVGKVLEDTLGFGDLPQADESDGDEHLCGRQNGAKPGNGSSGDAAASRDDSNSSGASKGGSTASDGGENLHVRGRQNSAKPSNGSSGDAAASRDGSNSSGASKGGSTASDGGENLHVRGRQNSAKPSNGSSGDAAASRDGSNSSGASKGGSTASDGGENLHVRGRQNGAKPGNGSSGDAAASCDGSNSSGASKGGSTASDGGENLHVRGRQNGAKPGNGSSGGAAASRDDSNSLGASKGGSTASGENLHVRGRQNSAKPGNGSSGDGSNSSGASKGRSTASNGGENLHVRGRQNSAKPGNGSSGDGSNSSGASKGRSTASDGGENLHVHGRQNGAKPGNDSSGDGSNSLGASKGASTASLGSLSNKEAVGKAREKTLGVDAPSRGVEGGGLQRHHSHRSSAGPDNSSGEDEVGDGSTVSLGGSSDSEMEQESHQTDSFSRRLELWLQRLAKPNGPIQYEVTTWPHWQS